ncbi:hypothetical protein ZIOFF_045898 [Zingiber officinale]|uniref:Reverse transcriptase Ty1/copia-type domain-containing protein n=1 Tax=Zingiber officinale TaxID=94328 RepID=A0A8J5G428_ZINOF|nr:hypothetical protein ZIOFF_045898 [Zingiber officinale]
MLQGSARLVFGASRFLGSDASSVDVIVYKLHAKISIKDLGTLSLFYGVEVHPTSNGLLLSQQKYVIDLLSKIHMLDSKPVSTPIAAGSRLTLHDGSLFFYATKFRQVFMHTPSETHLGAVKRLLQYLNGTRDLDIWSHASYARLAVLARPAELRYSVGLFRSVGLTCRAYCALSAMGSYASSARPAVLARPVSVGRT